MAACVVGFLGCFAFVKAKQRQRSAEAFLEALREGDQSTAARELQETPSLVKGLNLMNKQNALHIAVEEGQLVVLAAVVEAVLIAETQSKQGGDGIEELLNGQDAAGRTPLFIACAYGHSDCARFLMSNGADRNIPDCHGNVPLHMACLRNHLGLMFMLLSEFSVTGGSQTPSSVNVTNAAGLTPLHMAVWGRHSGAVQVLLQHGADINVRTAQDLPEQQSRTWPACVGGSTPLHLAAARGHVEICKILLKTFYERVLEPELLRRNRNLPPLITDLSALDPRLQVNNMGKMPYQIARHLGLIPLSMLLRPSVSLALLFGDEERNNNRAQGPPSLKTLATEALNNSLAAMVHQLSPPPVKAVSPAKRQPLPTRRQRPAALVLPASAQSTAASATAPEPVPLPSPPRQPGAAPRSPTMLSPRTPNLHAGRWPVQRDGPPVHTQPREVAEDDLLLPGMVGGEGGEASETIPQGQRLPLSQTADSVAGGGRQQWSPQLVFNATTASFPTLGAPADESPSQRYGSEAALEVAGPLTPSPAAPARNDTIADSVSGGQVALETTRPEPAGFAGFRSTDTASSSRASTSRARRRVSDTGRRRSHTAGAGAGGPGIDSDSTVFGTSRRVSISGRGSTGASELRSDLEEEEEEEMLTSTSHGGPAGRNGGMLSEEPRRLASTTARLAVQDAAARLLASSQLQSDAGELSVHSKPTRQSLSPSPSTLVVAADGFEVSSADNECGICLESPPTITVKPCNHLVCGTCALKMCTAQLQKPSLCPFCRGLIHGFTRAPGARPC